MRVRASKVFANFINATCEKRGIKATAYVSEFEENEYEWLVGDIDDAYRCNDISNHGFLQAIVLEWPTEYYASPRYLSTKTLAKLFREYRVKDWEGLEDMVADIASI